MFVIRRKIGQSVRIGEEIVIEVLDATPSRVKLGIHAPVGVRVARMEVLITERQNREAAGSAVLDALAGIAGQLRAGAPQRQDTWSEAGTASGAAVLPEPRQDASRG